MQGWQVFFEIPGKPPVELRDGESIIGRSRTSAVHIPETTVSRQHAKVMVGGAGRVLVSDLGSSNGTFVNGEKVEGERQLADGDRVLIGDAELIIRILAPEPVDATMKVTIPPLGAPLAAGTGTVRMDQPPPSPPSSAAGTVRLDLPPAPAAPPAIGAGGPGAATIAAPLDLPLAPTAPPRPTPLPLPPRIPDPPRPAPEPLRSAPLAPVVPPPAPRPPMPPPPPVSAPIPIAPSPAPAGGGDALSAIDFDKLGGPPAPAAKRASGAAPAPNAVAAGASNYGGFWIRVVAYLIDSAPMLFIVLIGVALSFFVDPTVGSLVSFLTLPYALFNSLYLPATKGNSIGKRMMGLAIVTDTTRPGEGLGWGKAFLRLLGYSVSMFTASIGFLLVAFTTKKQGLHDLIAGTYVVRTR